MNILRLPLEVFNETPCQSGALFSPNNTGLFVSNLFVFGDLLLDFGRQERVG